VEIVYKNDINDINIIFKKNSKWHSQYRNGNVVSLPEINISDFLLQHTQFIKIAPFKIINLVNVTDFSESRRVIILEHHSFNISKRFLPFLKIAYKIFNLQREKELNLAELHPSIPDEVKPISIIKIDNIDFSTTKYLLREGTRTKVFYENGTEHYLYETLNLITSSIANTSFVQINRNCIININYISSCQIDKKENVGCVKIDNQTFKISRRLLRGFIHNTLKKI
jgi:hypothetical protein